MKKLFASLLMGAGMVASMMPTSCSKEVQSTTYFDRTVAPILQTSCVHPNAGGGCHVQADNKGNAFGNLDLTTFAGVDRRRDLLINYGPYGQAAMLVKVVPPYSIEVQSFDGTKVTVTTDIKHTGGPIFDPTATAYETIRKWIDNGATANNTGVPPQTQMPRTGTCATDVPGDPAFNPNADPTAKDYQTFLSKVNPVFKGSCNAVNCHGTPVNELYLTCGDSDQQKRWNYFVAVQYLAQTPEQSELGRRPLSPSQGGAYHEGGTIFQTNGDSGYRAIIDWATEHGPPDFGSLDKNFLFFAHKVQPILVKKGCMMVQCHSAAMFHDYRLRGGSGGSFSLNATRKNYNLTLEQTSIESTNPNASRIVAKNLYRPEVFGATGGIAHRGGPLLEDFAMMPADPMRCAGPFDYDNGDLDKIPAYCVISEWITRERTAKMPAPLSAIFYVSRPPGGSEKAQDFDVFQGGTELHRVDATLAANGDVMMTGNDQNVGSGCGLNGADIRRPAVSWDAKKVAFAARSSAGEPFAVYEMDSSGMNCVKHAEINAGMPMGNGLLIHNFDPQYSPDGRIVFASTRGNIVNAQSFDYSGPTRTPADSNKPNSNLYVFEPNPMGGGNRIRQLTFQLNMERQPSFMLDGRVIFTAEKRAPHFYQLALRRINLDGGDYHPLYGQRSSIGAHEVTQVVELADKNFAAIFGDSTGGTLGIFNRSIGVDFTSPNGPDYLIDPSVIDPAGPNTPDPSFFLHSLKFPDKPGKYRSPAPLPSTHMLVSVGAGVGYDLVSMDPISGMKVTVVANGGRAIVDGIAIYERLSHGLFTSRLDEPNGHTAINEGKSEAEVTILDMPVLASLIFQNTPTGRPLEPDLKSFDIFEDMPPGAGPCPMPPANTVMDEFGQAYACRRSMGTVNLFGDGSARFKVPGGVPLVLKLPDTAESMKGSYPRYQREAFTFYPGEYVHQSFQTQFFNALCGQCHGATTGKPIDVALRPDIMTQASNTLARDATLFKDYSGGPGSRGAIMGPPP